MIFAYDADGARAPFDPARVREHIAGCVLCADPAVETISFFTPTTDAMRAVVLRLRQHATRPLSTPALAYGLCTACGERADVTERVEAVLVATARRVTVQ